MSQAVLILARAFLGGALVVAFSVLGETLRPKSFAGIFAAAPSIALASLLISGAAKGTADMAIAAGGMVLGAIVLAMALVVGVDAVKRFRGFAGSLAIIGTWLVGAGALYAVVR
ncbi:MAG: DUF3147 family protein [Candidatus Dormibacteraeota bacterium]|nr:DUF3147 family protein [Candidatus Dormibacteraeota bacterium]